ncbi:DUF4355 domain-containing protein [Pseudobacteroides cellulosolvens]|uniref:DUF4355 domain-containing protein n=1 Tax=Pseudobacteroides cellulosolvens TaxID=35825 RepID=UPI0006917654|nr:DUF4355 domain-containing protein [Pseudobacteroides cellulosolvens]
MDFNEIKTFIESNKDSNEELKTYLQGSLETWKTNNLQKEIDTEIKKRFPEADPKDIKMKELELKLEQMQKETFKKELTNSAIKTATEKQLPVSIIDFILGADLESTNKNIETFEAIFNDHIQKQVEARIAGNSYVPPNGGGSNNNSELQALQAEYATAMSNGNMPLAIAIKNKMVALQNKK